MSKVICTTMGNSIVGSDSDVYVHVSGNRFVKKAASDVNVGDQVLFRKQFVSTTVEEVEEVLDRSLRYRHAKETLHERNSRGELITKQRTFLIRGVAQGGDVRLSHENLEAMILKEAPRDFTPAEYHAMSDVVFALINPDFVPGRKETRNRAKETIEEWLRGKTIAIKLGDWSLYRNLDGLNSEFRNFDDTDTSHEGYFWNYRLQVVTRSVIQKYLRKCKGEGQGGSGEERADSGREKISVAPEIQLVVDHFMKDIDEQHVAARVTSVKHLTRRKRGEKMERPDPHLSQGIVVNEADYAEIEEIDMTTLASHYLVLDMALKMQLDNYVCLYILSRGLSKQEAKTAAVNISVNVYSLFDNDGSLLFREWKDMGDKSRTAEEEDKLIAATLPVIEKDLLNGRIDRESSYSRGTTLRLLETALKLRKALPKEYLDFNDLTNPSPAMGRPATSIVRKYLADDIKRIKRRLEMYGIRCKKDKKQLIYVRYSMCPLEIAVDHPLIRARWGALEEEAVQKYHELHGTSDDKSKSVWNEAINEDMERREGEYLKLFRELKSAGVEIWTETSMEEFLKTYGLEEILPHTPFSKMDHIPDIEAVVAQAPQKPIVKPPEPAPPATYTTLAGEEIRLNSLSQQERQIYGIISKSSCDFEHAARQVFGKMSRTKLQRRIDAMKQRPVYQIYLDMKARA